MTSDLRRGFKAEAERIALALRSELGLGAHDRLEPMELAKHLGIAVVSLTDLEDSGAAKSSIKHFTKDAPGELSAFTIVWREARLIVFNPTHSDGRVSSSLAHELAHVILKHEPHRAVDQNGCRRWNQNHEAEADYLAGALLVPQKAALRLVRAKLPVATAAEQLGVSRKMMTYRINITGAKKRVQRERKGRR